MGKNVCVQYTKQKYAVFVALCTLQPHTNTNSFLCAAWFPLQVIIICLFFTVLAEWSHSWMNTWYEMLLSGRRGSFGKQGLGLVGEDTWQKYKTISLMSPQHIKKEKSHTSTVSVHWAFPALTIADGEWSCLSWSLCRTLLTRHYLEALTYSKNMARGDWQSDGGSGEQAASAGWLVF